MPEHSLPEGVAISVEQVAKRFQLRRDSVGDLRERFGALNPFVKSDRTGAVAASRDFWALKEVSFTVQPGRPVGIVGHNGSGKSTMLKLLTGIIAPTSGAIRTRGRIGALIEVGAGFHPDLSGRENVYLSGSILGLSRRDIDRKFDEIVAFAGLEKFMETPVKRYSSGMYMRLGFSVAAHTDPDILLIDEVLAVGDALFQRKCLRRLKEFVAQGGAVVFVSHSMEQVAELCETCVWLDHGEVRYVGNSADAIGKYLEVVSEREYADLQRTHPEEWAVLEEERLQEELQARLREEEERRQQEEAEQQRRDEEAAELLRQQARLTDFSRTRLLSVIILDMRGRPRSVLEVGQPFEVRVKYRFVEKPANPVINIEFWRDDEQFAFGTSNFDHHLSFAGLPLTGEAVLKVGFLSLNAGTYRLRARLFSRAGEPDWVNNPEDVIECAAQIRVEAGNFGHGFAYLPTEWGIVGWSPPADSGTFDRLTEKVNEEVSLSGEYTVANHPRVAVATQE